MARSRVILRALLAFLILAPSCVHAHTTRLSAADITVSGRNVQVALILNGADLDAAVGTALAQPDGKISKESLRKSRQQILEYVAARSRISNSAGSTCVHDLRALSADAEHVKMSLSWSCPPLSGALVYDNTLFHEIDPATRQMVTVKGDASRLALLSVGSQRVTLVRTQARIGDVFVHYLVAGIEHIAIGYDHIAFLVAVILWGRRLWPLVGVVTAFTVAHSITLSLAVLGVLSPPPALVEIAIALSIVYVAAENFFVRDLRRRWIITFVFGLLHGFGFAGVLREYGIPSDALVPALAAFNIGVELGQIAIVTVVLLLLHVLESNVRPLQPAPNVRLVYPISGLVLVLALYWLWQRI